MNYTFTEPSSKIFLMATPPKPVGGYLMGVRLVLGWKWVDV
jgi:hypothetical protein